MNSSNFVFILMLVCVTSTVIESISTLDPETQLETVPNFVELSNHPISQAFFSAISIRVREHDANKGFQHVIALIRSLIRGTKQQLQTIKKANERNEGECIVTSHKFRDRSVFFNGQTSYFKNRQHVAIEEKSESINIKSSRDLEFKENQKLIVSINAKYARQARKWGKRILDAENALTKINNAIKAVQKYKSKSPHSFIQENIQESLKLFSEIKKINIAYPTQLVDLSRNDAFYKNNLLKWLYLLKTAILNNLNNFKSIKKEIDSIHFDLDRTFKALNAKLTNDSTKLAQSIANAEVLIKVYGENAKIYENLALQNTLLIQSNKKYCDAEKNSYVAQKSQLNEQRNVFLNLRLWLRKNFASVKSWLKKKYNH